MGNDGERRRSPSSRAPMKSLSFELRAVQRRADPSIPEIEHLLRLVV